jgi:hypothetical protein
VLLRARGLSLSQVAGVLAARRAGG